MPEVLRIGQDVPDGPMTLLLGIGEAIAGNYAVGERLNIHKRKGDPVTTASKRAYKEGRYDGGLALALDVERWLKELDYSALDRPALCDAFRTLLRTYHVKEEKAAAEIDEWLDD